MREGITANIHHIKDFQTPFHRANVVADMKSHLTVERKSDKEFVLHVQGAELSVLPKRWFLLRQRQQVPVRGDYNNDLAIRDQ